MPIELTDFEPAHQHEAKAVILNGLASHWGQVDHTLNADLDDLGSSHRDTATTWFEIDLHPKPAAN